MLFQFVSFVILYCSFLLFVCFYCFVVVFVVGENECSQSYSNKNR